MTTREQQLRARRRLVYENPFALRIAAFSVIVRFFYTAGVLVFTGYALTVDKTLLRTALALLIAIPVVWLWAAMATSGLRCLVCPNPVLKSRRSVKHRDAKPLFGSYTLGMAFRLIFAKRFKCMHCGTMQRMSERAE